MGGYYTMSALYPVSTQMTWHIQIQIQKYFIATKEHILHTNTMYDTVQFLN